MLHPHRGERQTALTKFTDGPAKPPAPIAVARNHHSMRDGHQPAQSQLADTAGKQPGHASPHNYAQMTDYLQEIAVDFHNSADGGFYLPGAPLYDTRFERVPAGT